MSTDDGIAGRVALVTGAGRGIGAAVARMLAGRGATVAAVDRDAPALRLLADGDPRCHAYPADVSDAAAVARLVDGVEAELGPIALLANVAGILRTGTVRHVRDADWADSLAVNTTGVFLVCRAVADRMVARADGAIVTVGSNAADTPRVGMAAYAASKAAATALTRCLGLELAPHGIRCNVVSPGSTDTPMQRQLWHTPDDAAGVIAGDPDTFRTGIPLGRLAEPDDVAAAVTFLLSDRARHVTLHDLRVDGGATPR